MLQNVNDIIMKITVQSKLSLVDLTCKMVGLYRGFIVYHVSFLYFLFFYIYLFKVLESTREMHYINFLTVFLVKYSKIFSIGLIYEAINLLTEILGSNT